MTQTWRTRESKYRPNVFYVDCVIDGVPVCVGYIAPEFIQSRNQWYAESRDINKLHRIFETKEEAIEWLKEKSGYNKKEVPHIMRETI